MLSEAKHLCADGERPFAAAQGDTEGKHLRGSTVKLERSSSFEPCLNYVMLTAEHLASSGSPGEQRATWRGAGHLARASLATTFQVRVGCSTSVYRSLFFVERFCDTLASTVGLRDW
jgi:hypothetical protein